MQRVCKKFFFALIFMLFLMSKPYNILGFNLEEEQVVTKDKIWTITLNDSIMLDNLAYEDVFVVNNEGERANITLEVSVDKKNILIKPPIGGYEVGVKYELNVSDKVESIESNKLDKATSIKFIIESPVYIVKINDINLFIKKGQPYTHQKKVTVDFSNGIRRDRDVIWDVVNVDTTKVGIYTFKGKVAGYESEVSLTLTVWVDYNELVKASPVIATISWDSPLYKDMSTKSNKLALVEKASKVEIIRDVEYKWYYIKTKAGQYGWISANNLIIPKDPITNTKRLTKEELEGYVNVKKFKSNTKYFMWVDLDRQTVNIFQGAEGKYKLLKSMTCATGRNISPTTRGTFTIQNRGEWFFKGKSGAKNWVGFNGQYLFHSIVMDANKNVKDYTLGKRASAGCIRLSINDSKWLYDNITYGTTVWIN